MSTLDPVLDFPGGAHDAKPEVRPDVRAALGWVRWVGLGALVIMLTATALAVIYSKHQARSLYADVLALERTRDELNVEYGRLMLEQSTLATHSRVDGIARSRLGMAPPSLADVVVIGP
jgi:cell division protein FtsL